MRNGNPNRSFPNQGGRRKILGATGRTATVAIISLMLPFTPALAESYPDQAVHVIVPFPPGGATDTNARIISEGLSRSLEQSFVVENKAGAGGVIGLASLVKSKADGYNLAIGPVGATIIAKLIGMQVTYDPIKDIAPIALIGSMPMVIVASADSGLTSFKSMIDRAKSKPSALSYGTSGLGTPGNLAFEYLKKIAGIDVIHVPYKGDSPLTSDLLGGQLEIGVLTGPAAVAQAKNGKLRLLAVTSATRYPQLPDVPTVEESGYKDFGIEIWNLLVAPTGTDQAKLETLNKATNAFLDKDSTKATLQAQGYLPPIKMNLTEVKDFLAKQRVKWETIVKITGVKIGG